jgi:hypothetical protein
MNKFKLICSLFLFIPLVMFTAVPQAFSIGHYGIPGTTDACSDCHNFVDGSWVGTGTVPNIRFVLSDFGSRQVNGEPVSFTKFDAGDSPLPGTADGTLADGDPSKLDGPCEVCHLAANVKYHSGDADDGTDHYDGMNCLSCHPHFVDDIVNYFEPRFIGTQSHTTHFTDPKGPLFGEDPNCNLCHYPGDYNLFGPTGDTLEATTVCDPCHSPDGAFDGSADGKAKWEDSVYEENGTDLKPGNENWCAGCHDDGTSIVDSVSAPNVMGDNATYGYNISGHGSDPLNYVFCEDCHDLAVSHTDGNARTYSFSGDNYVAGYRLAGDMTIPRGGGTLVETSFRLCFDTCHVFSRIFGLDTTTPTTNFRDSNRGLQYHDLHLRSTAGLITWDSDWDGTSDTGLSCPACHNLHGSPTMAMTRHGELISTPGTTDKVPALNFRWETESGIPTTSLLESRYGFMRGGGNPPLPDFNKVCTFCHVAEEDVYYREPVGVQGITIIKVWTTDYNENIKTNFNPGGNVMYHVELDIVGSSPLDTFFMKSPKLISKAFNTSDADWETRIGKSKEGITPGTYHFAWKKTIPTEASSGSTARVKIQLKLFDVKGGTLIDKDTKGKNFNIN